MWGRCAAAQKPIARRQGRRSQQTFAPCDRANPSALSKNFPGPILSSAARCGIAARTAGATARTAHATGTRPPGTAGTHASGRGHGSAAIGLAFPLFRQSAYFIGIIVARAARAFGRLEDHDKRQRNKHGNSAEKYRFRNAIQHDELPYELSYELRETYFRLIVRNCCRIVKAKAPRGQSLAEPSLYRAQTPWGNHLQPVIDFRSGTGRQTYRNRFPSHWSSFWRWDLWEGC